jgi:hypothetical protein
MKRRPSKTIHLSPLLGILGMTLLLPAQTTAPSQLSPTKLTPAFLRGSAWKRLRTAMPAIMAGNGRSTGFESWNIAASLDGFGQTRFFDALEKSDPFFVNNVEAASTQKVSAEIPKDLDHRLSPAELSAVKAKLAVTNIAYRDTAPYPLPIWPALRARRGRATKFTSC